jgi:hypothetical protein
MTTLIDWETVLSAKLGVAALGVALLLAEILLRRAGRPQALKRCRDALLAATAFAALPGWWNLSSPIDLPWPSLRAVHLSDAFHYYMGPKYFRELGYEHLYECCAAAEVELGRAREVVRRTYRDLASNTFVDGRTVLERSLACKRRFEPGRWQVFVHDVAWFRSRMPGWQTTMQDWGYNATPAWNVLGAWLAGTDPVTKEQLALLTVLDVPLLIAMWGLVAWAFGWRPMCVALIFWGTNIMAGGDWTSGSILRQEWLLASVAGICLLRRQRPVAAGAAIAYAASLTIFPGFMALGIGIKALTGWLAERRLSFTPEHRGLLVGAGLAIAVVLPLSALEGGGARVWLDFVENTRADMAPSPNNVGLPMLLGYDGDNLLYQPGPENRARSVEEWSEARTRTLEGRTPLLWAILAAYGALFVGTRREPDWVVAILGLGFAGLALQLSCYYHAVLLLFGLLWPRHGGMGLALCGVSLASHLIYARWPDVEQYSTGLSLAVVCFVIYAVAAVRFSKPQPSARDAAAAGNEQPDDVASLEAT